jgi:hypothetical protein
MTRLLTQMDTVHNRLVVDIQGVQEVVVDRTIAEVGDNLVLQQLIGTRLSR